MTSYIGQNTQIGAFETQNLVADGVQVEFNLSFKVGSNSSILVVADGVVQRPGAGHDYIVTSGGTKILFTAAPTATSLYVLYLGRELSVPRTIGNEPNYFSAVGDGVEDTFVMPLGPVNEAAIIVFADGVQQRPTDDFTVSGSNVIFGSPPSNGALLDFYIHGVERSDIAVIGDVIDGDKTFNNSVVVEGDLTVNGTTVTLNTTELNVEDNIIRLNKNFTSGVPSLDLGIEGLRGSSPKAMLVWDESLDRWVAGVDGDLEAFVTEDQITDLETDLSNHITDFNNHVSDVANPHSVTKTQVGLANVTDDAQLKREAGDINSFTEKVTLVDDDLFLIEDSADSNNKKKAKLESILNAIPDASDSVTGLINTSAQTFAGSKTFNNPNFQVGSSNITVEHVISSIGKDRTSNGAASLDLIGDTTYTSYGARLLRNSTANGTTFLTHRGTGSLNLRTEEAGDFNILTGGTQRLKINGSDGFIGVGVTAAVSLDIKRDAADDLTRIRIVNASSNSATDASFNLGNDSSGSAAAFRINSSTNTTFAGGNSLNIVQGLSAPIGFATSATLRWSLTTDGHFLPAANNTYDVGSSSFRVRTFYAVNALDTSDARLKTDLVSIDPSVALDKIQALNPVQFKFLNSYDPSSRQRAGFLAQELSEAIPEAVVLGDLTNKNYGEPGFEAWSIQIAHLIPYLVGAIQKLNNKIHDLEEEIATLKQA